MRNWQGCVRTVIPSSLHKAVCKRAKYNYRLQAMPNLRDPQDSSQSNQTPGGWWPQVDQCVSKNTWSCVQRTRGGQQPPRGRNRASSPARLLVESLHLQGLAWYQVTIIPIVSVSQNSCRWAEIILLPCRPASWLVLPFLLNVSRFGHKGYSPYLSLTPCL
jgi:hypothetical protein